MEVIFEIIFYVVGELLLTVIGEALAELLGLHSISNRMSHRQFSGLFFGFLYAVAGFALGALSLKFIPLLVIGGASVSIAYFVVAPVLAGLALCLVNWLMNYGIDDRAPFFQAKKFVNGVLFALTFSLTRATFG